MSVSSSSPSSSAQAYQAAGVNLQAAAGVVGLAKQAAGQTTVADLPVLGGIGGFSGAFELPAGYTQPVILTACDGVGTKVLLAHQVGDFSTVGIDLVAMNANDLLANGGRPLVFMDYVAAGVLDLAQMEQVLGGVAAGCVQAGCQLIGGETAEMPGLYAKGHVDMAGFCLGVAEKANLYPKPQHVIPGDVVIGLASSGFHSNGYSLVRKVLAEHNVDVTRPLPKASTTISQALLAPTKLYVKPVLKALQAHPSAVRAMAHITGGGFTENIPRVLPDGVAVALTPWALPPVYQWFNGLAKLGWAELATTFNAGIGYVLLVDKEAAPSVMETLAAEDPTLAPTVIGQVVAQPNAVAPPTVLWVDEEEGVVQ